jgi:hypothetical protein
MSSGQPLISFDELTSVQAKQVLKEAKDRESLLPLTAPTREHYLERLTTWASIGFPDDFIVQSFSFGGLYPIVCADGVSRPEPIDYMKYLAGTDSLETLVTTNVVPALAGIRVTCRMTACFEIRVSKV